MPEVPWFSEPPNARLAIAGVRDGDVICGWLHFDDPNGQRAVIPVTHGEATSIDGTPLWHVDVEGDVATVSPSVHFIGRWHSPNPVTFNLVDELAADDG